MLRISASRRNFWSYIFTHVFLNRSRPHSSTRTRAQLGEEGYKYEHGWVLLTANNGAHYTQGKNPCSQAREWTIVTQARESGFYNIFLIREGHKLKHNKPPIEHNPELRSKHSVSDSWVPHDVKQTAITALSEMFLVWERDDNQGISHKSSNMKR